MGFLYFSNKNLREEIKWNNLITEKGIIFIIDISIKLHYTYQIAEKLNPSFSNKECSMYSVSYSFHREK